MLPETLTSLRRWMEELDQVPESEVEFYAPYFIGSFEMIMERNDAVVEVMMILDEGR